MRNLGGAGKVVVSRSVVPSGSFGLGCGYHGVASGSSWGAGNAVLSWYVVVGLESGMRKLGGWKNCVSGDVNVWQCDGDDDDDVVCHRGICTIRAASHRTTMHEWWH